MRLFPARSVLVLAFLASACYQSPVPPAAPALPIDTALLGEWEEVDPDASPTVVTITRGEASEYLIDMPWDLPGGFATLHASAFITRAGAVEFINLRETGDDNDEEYIVMKLSRNADRTISVATLKRDLPRFHARAALQRYLEQHAHDPAIVQDVIRMRKVSAR